LEFFKHYVGVRPLIPIIAYRFVLLTTLAILCIASTVSAQRPTREITVQKKYDPRFEIEPLVQKLQGRSGDVMAFSVQATSEAKPTRIEVLPVALKQIITGQVTFDEQAEANDLIQLTSPRIVTLNPDKPEAIEGMISIPSSETASNYIFGVLIRDIGLENEEQESPDDGAALEIKFVTQYLVRIEVAVTNVRTENARGLVLSNTMLESKDGRPFLRTQLRNPTNSPFVLNSAARVYSQYTGERMQPLGLTMPCRQSSEGAERYEIIVLPNSTIELVEFLPSAVSSGRYKIDLDLKQNDSVVKHEVVDLMIDAKDFPAQAVMIAEMDNRISVSPAQVELSQIRGGNRRISLTVKNPTENAAEIEIGVVSGYEASEENSGDGLPDGFDADTKDIIVQPAKLTLSPGRSRKISITLRSNQSTTPVQFATLDVRARLDGHAETINKRLPVAIIRDASGTVEAEVKNLRFSKEGQQFIVDVNSQGNRHLPLVSRLLIAGQSGLRHEIQGGFSRWLLPNRSTTIEFPIKDGLPPDTYELVCELQVNGRIVEERQIVEVGALVPQSALNGRTQR
jgi:hypothetical protein